MTNSIVKERPILFSVTTGEPSKRGQRLKSQAGLTWKQRLQDISEEDARAEGVESPEAERERHDWNICPRCGGTRLCDDHSLAGCRPDSDCTLCDTHKKRFEHLWTSINGTGSWAENPFVWAVSFVLEK